jgi:hypothetical protein
MHAKQAFGREELRLKNTIERNKQAREFLEPFNKLLPAKSRKVVKGMQSMLVGTGEGF